MFPLPILIGLPKQANQEENTDIALADQAMAAPTHRILDSADHYSASQLENSHSLSNLQ